MSDKPSTIVTIPTDAAMKIIFEDYALALGKVAYASNYLHERLGFLFSIVAGTSREIAAAVWYSSDSDRAQREMLRTALSASPPDRWTPRLPTARDDLLWLIEESNKFANRRNDAVHAPCILSIQAPEATMAASPFSGHQRAKNLLGKDLLVEFDWCERWAEGLSRFSDYAETSLRNEHFPWPEKPARPGRKRRTDFKDQRPQENPK
jgi:hypothetical protein